MMIYAAAVPDADLRWCAFLTASRRLNICRENAKKKFIVTDV